MSGARYMVDNVAQTQLCGVLLHVRRQTADVLKIILRNELQDWWLARIAHVARDVRRLETA